MPRLIDVDALGIGLCNPDVIMDRAYAAGWNGVVRLLQSAPTITPKSLVRHGRPIYHNRPAVYEHYEMVQQIESGEPLYKRQHYKLQDNPVAYCPECGKRLCSRFSNYCPNCGCKMDLADDSHG